MSSAVFLLIDIGASFIKVALCDSKDWNILANKQVAFPGFLPNKNNFKEVDPKQILKAFTQILDEFVKEEYKYLGILLSSQMHGFILSDDNGKALSNFISWQDCRSKKVLELISPQEQEDSGNEIKAGIAVANLHWLAENNLIQANAYPCTIADFLLSNLSQSKPRIHLTNAAGFGAFSLKKMDWNFDLIKKLKLSSLCWTELTEHDRPYLRLKWKSKEIPCFISIGDQQAALYGIGLKENQLSINIGTGSQVSMLSANFIPGNYQSRPFLKNKFLKTITHIPAGRSLNALIKLLTELNENQRDIESIWTEINSKLTTIDSTKLKLDLSFFPSSTGDYGSITNIQEENLNVTSLFAAAFETMAKNYYRLSHEMGSDNDWDNIILSGGIVQKNQYLVKRLRNLFNSKSIELIAREVETLEGLKIIAREDIFSKL